MERKGKKETQEKEAYGEWTVALGPGLEVEYLNILLSLQQGRVAKLVSRPLSMRKVPGSKPGMSIIFLFCFNNEQGNFFFSFLFFSLSFFLFLPS